MPPIGWGRVGVGMAWIRVILAGLLGVLCLASEGWRRPFTVLGPAQGLPSGAITTLTQDAEGFIWVGTENGLLRYEGGHCRRWAREDGLPSGFIHRVLPAREGGVWVATLRGLARVREGRVELASFAGGPGFADAVALDQGGRLWAMTPGGLFIQGEGLEFRLRAPRPAGLSVTLAAGARGAMHMGSKAGLATFGADGTRRDWGPGQGLPADGVALVVEDGEGRIWAGSGRKLAMKAPGTSEFTDQSARLDASLSPNSVPFADGDGSVWLPTQAGALHLAGGRTERVDAAGGLPFRWVRTVFRDREGTLWILGTALARLQGGGRVWNHALGTGISGEVVWSITRLPGGGILAATDDGAQRVTPTAVTRIPGTEGHRIKSLALDRSGTLWMVSTIGPTLWLRKGRPAATVAPLGDFGSAVNSVMEDSRGQIWLGHVRYGILRWDPAAQRLVQDVKATGTGTLGVFRIREDVRGRLWAATTAGLYLKEVDGPWRLFTEKQGLLPFGLYGMAFLPDGSAWVHYQEPQGLTRIRVDGDRLTVLEQRVKGQGLHSNQVYAVEVDERGQTWATTDQGVDRLDPPLHVGQEDGMVSEDCAIQALLAESGRIWVGTAAGLVRYEAGEAHGSALPAQAHILQFTAGARQLEPPYREMAPVAHRDATVSFRVASPSYLDERQVRFQVRLLGLEDTWREVDSPVVRYTALPGGHYRFEVRAAGREGVFGPVAGLDFRVLPPWWGTWWALGLGGLALLGVGLVILRFRVAALARSKADLEVLVARRTEELSARNEELSSALGKVKQLSGLLPICASCKKIRDDTGYWNQLEHYITAHTDADFTHGICPDCAEALYPERAKVRREEPAEPAT